MLSLSVSHGVVMLLPPAEGDSAAHKEALAHLRENAFEKARAVAKKILEENKDDMRARLLVALGWLGEGKDKECWHTLELARAQDPRGSAALYGTVGEVFATNRRLYRAIHCLETSLSLADDRARSLRLADLYMSQARFAEAARVYEKHANATPARLQLARIALLQHHYAAAVDHATQALAGDQAPAIATFVLASALLCQDNLAAADDAFVRCLEAGVAPAQVAYSRALIALLSGDHSAAAAHFAKAAPDAVSTQIGQAVLAQVRGDLPEALRHATHALRHNPQEPLCNFILANIYSDQGDFEKAPLAYRAAAPLCADFALSHFSPKSLAETTSKAGWGRLSLMALCFREGYYSRTINLAGSEPAAKAGHPLYAAWQARALAALEKHEAARTLLEKAATRFPEWSLPVQLLAEVAASTGSHAQAAGHYRTLLEQQPNASHITLRLAEQLFLANQIDEALQAYSKAASLNPSDGLALNQKAWILSEKKGDHEKALKFALESTAANPNQPGPRDTLAWIYYRLGQTEKSLEIYQPLLDQPVTDPAMTYRLGCALQKQGETTRAAVRFEAALNKSATFDGAEDAVRRLREIAGW
ncbi:MAG: tetratricopeptide repeat protein [Verrucomicrobiales bacterium]